MAGAGFMWSRDPSRKTPREQSHVVSQESEQKTQFMSPELNPVFLELVRSQA